MLKELKKDYIEKYGIIKENFIKKMLLMNKFLFFNFLENCPSI
jgi:hypothetical protein